MLEPSANHLVHKRAVPVRDALDVYHAAVNVSVQVVIFADAANEHVHFDVLTEQVLCAHQSWINVPHSHGYSFVRI